MEQGKSFNDAALITYPRGLKRRFGEAVNRHIRHNTQDQDLEAKVKLGPWSDPVDRLFDALGIERPDLKESSQPRKKWWRRLAA